MSATSQGPGWWQASDGLWYSPESAPGPVSIPPPPGAPTSVGNPDAAGFIRSLYDFQFDHFVTPKVLRFFYGFFVIVVSIGAAVFLLAALVSGDSGTAFGALIFVPIGYFVYLVLIRMYFELVAALFRIADDLRAVRHNTSP